MNLYCHDYLIIKLFIGRTFFEYIKYHFTNAALRYKGFANIMNNYDNVRDDVINGV
jgi:hypothetical protein